METVGETSDLFAGVCSVFATLLEVLILGERVRERFLALARVPVLLAKLLLDLEVTDLRDPNNLLLLPRSCPRAGIHAKVNKMKTVKT